MNTRSWIKEAVSVYLALLLWAVGFVGRGKEWKKKRYSK
jgi:hypothetical protein